MYKKQLRKYPHVQRMEPEEAYDTVRNTRDSELINLIKSHADRKQWDLYDGDTWRDWQEVYDAACKTARETARFAELLHIAGPAIIIGMIVILLFILV